MAKTLLVSRAELGKSLIAYGPFGLCLIALLDSAFIPLPAGPDVVMILLSVSRPLPWVVACAALGTLGSVAGCVILYYISAHAGKRALARFARDREERVKELIKRHDILALFASSILPPPFPFKIFIVTAGVFRAHLLRFIFAITAGRMTRFLIEGYIVSRYGEEVKDLLAAYSWRIGAGAVAIVGVAILVSVAHRIWRRRRGATASNIVEAGP